MTLHGCNYSLWCNIWLSHVRGPHWPAGHFRLQCRRFCEEHTPFDKSILCQPRYRRDDAMRYHLDGQGERRTQFGDTGKATASGRRGRGGAVGAGPRGCGGVLTYGVEALKVKAAPGGRSPSELVCGDPLAAADAASCVGLGVVTDVI